MSGRRDREKIERRRAWVAKHDEVLRRHYTVEDHTERDGRYVVKGSTTVGFVTIYPGAGGGQRHRRTEWEDAKDIVDELLIEAGECG